MNYEQIKLRLAPCGLHCGKCFTFKDGDIGHSSKKLKESLGEFDVYADRFADLLEENVLQNIKISRKCWNTLQPINAGDTE